MAVWIEKPDPVSQSESRRVPYSSGVIGAKTGVEIYKTLYRKLMRAEPQIYEIYDYFAMECSRLFSLWKDTRRDFRFKNEDEQVVLTVQVKIAHILVEIASELIGFRNENGLFPITLPESADRPNGLWMQAEVSTFADAQSIVRELQETLISN